MQATVSCYSNSNSHSNNRSSNCNTDNYINMLEIGCVNTYPNYQSSHFMNNSLVAMFGPSMPSMAGHGLGALDALEGLDSDLESEASTLSSSPTTSIDEPTLDEAVLRAKFASLGIDLNQELSVPRISIQNSSDDESGNESDDSSNEPCGRTPLLRSTSLKSGKTPPSTPHRKKIVRFADSLGLDLAAVRHILQDDLPQIPQSAYVDLKVPKDWIPDRSTSNGKRFTIAPATQTRQVVPAKPQAPWLSLYQQQQRTTLIPQFVEPCVQLNFMDRVRNQLVCLENCSISSGAGSISVTCVSRVMNVSFEKQVLIRYTANEWSTWTDCLASYIPQSGDCGSDRFTATFHVRSATGASLVPGNRVLFAVKYMANNEEYWDNNVGLNYSLTYRL